MNKVLFFISFLIFSTCCSFAQNDSAEVRGTIKIAKPKIKRPQVYIQAWAKFDKYNFEKIKYSGPANNAIQPFPVVEGHSFPFNYTVFFKEKFKTKNIDLEKKEADTVWLEVRILANGKAYVKDLSPLLMVNGVPAFYNENVGGYELNNLHLNCLEFVRSIKEWFPAYIEEPKKSKFKNQTVIKPNKKNIDSMGIITIIFSTTPFDY